VWPTATLAPALSALEADVAASARASIRDRAVAAQVGLASLSHVPALSEAEQRALAELKPGHSTLFSTKASCDWGSSSAYSAALGLVSKGLPYDALLYKQRHKIENMFGRLKDWRRIHTRYDRCVHTYLSTTCIAAAVAFWLGSMSPELQRREQRGGESSSSQHFRIVLI
jgi:hypothetical protein